MTGPAEIAFIFAALSALGYAWVLVAIATLQEALHHFTKSK